MSGDPRYKKVLDELWETHLRKSSDYGSDTDFLANLRAGEGFGVPAWVGAMVRANDKVFRIQSFAKKGVLANESLRDSLVDLASYAILSLILYEETQQEKQ